MIRKLFLAALLPLALSDFSFAQIRGGEQPQEEDEYFNTEAPRQRSGLDLSPFWYGAGAQLGFSSNNFSSRFQIGVSPIVGYKVTNFLSVGPRGSITYNNFRFETNVGTQRENWVEWSAGLFTRARVFGPFFVHGEYSLVSEQDFLLNGEIERVTRGIPYLGGGISQGGGPGAMGFEIMILFRLDSPDRLNDTPFDIRTGINYNF